MLSALSCGRALAVVVLCLPLAVTALSSARTADTDVRSHAAGPGREPLRGPATITLITGDRVTLVPSPDGGPRVVLDGGSTAPDDYAIRRNGARVEVIPHSVLDLVPRVLDPDLFDVAGLVAMGYGDARSQSLPLIVHKAPGVNRLRTDPALSSPVDLPSIAGAAVALDKAQARGFSADLRRLADRPGPTRRSDVITALDGIDRIWLDGEVTAATAHASVRRPASAGADLDEYLTQVGAQEAWEAGLDGTGVTVAVLDSGIDTAHPALAGRVRDERDFTDSGDPQDRQGHGTHVASLIAGSGAGSDGARRGVAPAIDLLNGKVLGDEGEGRLSWVIAGMEWAVANDADIVNLSLAASPGESDDPVVQSLDALATGTDTLFVVAAGNSGWNGWSPQTVTSPGTADSALTVGAVNGRDAVAGFSGQGPTSGSYRTKPDLVAPGVAILGARAGARDEDLYVPMDGTSMATPITAGAAALVKQQHPDWSWRQVRSALISSADHLPGPWSSGAGRLALDHAVAVETTTAPSTLSPGPSLHPSESPTTTTVTLTNTGLQPRTYTAADGQTAPSDGSNAPESALVVRPGTVTVAAGGTATVDVVFDPAQVADDFWHGHVDLAGDDGSLLRLPFSTYDEPERYWLDLTVLDRVGKPYAGGQVPLLNTDNGYSYTARLDDQGHARLRVAPGTYGAVAVLRTDEQGATTTTVAGVPAVEVRGDTALSIDARDALPVEAPSIREQRTRPTELSLVWQLTSSRGTGHGDVLSPPIDDVLEGRVFVSPSEPADPDRFTLMSRWRLEPDARGQGTPDAYELVDVQDRLAVDAATLTAREVRELAQVTAHTYAPTADASVLRGLVSSTPLTPGIVHWRQTSAPATETVLMTADEDVHWGYDSDWLDEDLWLHSPRVAPHRAGSVVEHHFRRGLHVGVRPGSASHSTWGLFLEQGLTDGHLGGPVPQTWVRSASTTLYRDGDLVATYPDVFGWFDVPTDRASYQAVGEVELSDGSRSETRWGFTSEASAPNAPDTELPLLTVDYRPSVDGLGAARRGQDLRFDLRISHLHATDRPQRIEAARLQWSTDTGATWHDAFLRCTGAATFTGTVKGTALRTARTVSVRLRASDTGDNTIDQTITGFLPVH